MALDCCFGTCSAVTSLGWLLLACNPTPHMGLI